MQLLRPPNLTIDVRISATGTAIELRSPGRKPLEIESTFRRSDLRRQREKLRANLEELKERIGQGLYLPDDVDWDAVDGGMRLLLERGRRFAYQLFGDGNGPDVEKFCREACYWNLKRWGKPFVEVAMDQMDQYDTIPFEFMPLFRIKEPAKIRDFRSLDEAARGVLGFSAIVKRRIRAGNQEVSLLLHNTPRLSVKLFQFADLEVVRLALDIFRRTGAHVNGPWPTEALPEDEFVRTSCEHIWDFRKIITKRRKPSGDQIYYFGCHCETTGDDTEEYAVVLSHDGKAPHRVTLGEMQSHFLSKRKRSDELPLVFMNACGSAVEPSGVTAFPGFFLAAGYRGYIGTEANIPDGVAGEFARLFHSEFLAGVPLGQALLDARRALLRRHANPLGILYTAYAEPELQAFKA